MAGNPYDAVLDDMQADGAPEANPYEAVVDEMEQDEAQKDALVVDLFGRARGLNPEKRVGVLDLAKKTGLESRIIDENYDSLATTWEKSQFDARKWRTENPEQWAIISRRPEIGDLVMADQQLPILAKALNAAIDAGEWLREKAGTDAEQGPTRDKTGGGLDARTEEAKAAGPKDDVRNYRVERRQVSMVEDATTRALQQADEPTRLATIPVRRFQEARAGHDIAKMQFELMSRQATNMAAEFGHIESRADTYELEKRIHDAKRLAVPKNYGEGAWEQQLSNAAAGVASQVEVFKTAGAGFGIGSALGYGVGLLATKNPALAAAISAKTGAATTAAVTLIGGALGFKVGTALGSFTLEAGSAYGDLLEVKTDTGQPLSQVEAMGASLIYGTLAAGIEVASMDVFLDSMGPLGAALKTGSRKAALETLMKDATFRQIAARAGKAFLKSAAAEGSEEAGQGAVQDAVTYFARSFSAGELQQGKHGAFGAVDPYDAAQNFDAGAAGGFALGGPAAAVNVTTQLLERDRAVRAGKVIEAITNIGDSPTARAAPEAVAEMIQAATARGGEPVTHVYIDPEGIREVFFQDGQTADEATEAALREFLGPDGLEQVNEALATGGKVEVPLADYMRRMGGSDAAQQLAEHTTTAQERMTPRQLRAQDESITRQAKEIAARVEKGEMDEVEQEMFDLLEESLVQQGVFSASDAVKAVSIHRAHAEAMASRFKKADGTSYTSDELFKHTITVALKGLQSKEEARAEAPTGTTEAPERLAAQEQATASEPLSERATNAVPEERASDLYVDPTSGLRTRRAWDETPRTPGKRIAIITSTDVKAINDDPTGAHDTTNALLRAIGRAVATVDPRAARSGTNFLLEVSGKAELKAAIEAINAALPDPSLHVEGVLGDGLDATFKKLDDVTDAKRARGQLPPRGGTNFDLTKLPDLERRLNGNASLAAASPLEPSLVQKAGAMTPEEFFRSAYQDRDVPGILSALGWRLIPRKAYVASLDLKGLKKINETLGKEAGNQVLKLFGEVAQRLGGSTVDFAHLSGDEYAAQHDDPAELEAFLDELRAELKNAEVTHTLEGGQKVSLRAEFRDGIGEGTYGAADRELNRAKRAGSDSGRDVVRRIPRAAGEAAGSPGRQDGVGELAGSSDLEAGTARPRRRSAAPQAFRDRRGDGRKLEQDDAVGVAPRGFIDIQGTAGARVFRITLNEKADLSTFLHESSHAFLELLGDLAEREDAPQQVKDDFAKALTFMGAESRAAVTTEHHEKFARGFEQYLMEGKAPSRDLEGAFQRFRHWLVAIYKGFIREPLNDDIRGVFDRLLATDEEIARARQGMGFDLGGADLFGIPAEQIQEYLRARQQATSHAERAADLRFAKEEKRKADAKWKAEFAKLSEAAEMEFEALSARRAQLFLRGAVFDGEGVSKESRADALDLAAVERAVGADARRFITRKRGGTHPDVVAELYGFPTGEAMLKAIIALPKKDAWVKERAESQMAERHGDLLRERDELREVVAKGLHGDATEKWLMAELKGLGLPLTREAFKRAAQQIVSGKRVGELHPGRMLQAERRSAEKALRAATKGDRAQAREFKREQVLNFYLHREVTEAIEDREALEELAAELRKDKARARLGKASPVYRGGVDAILEAIGLKEQEAREEPLPSIGEVVATMEGDAATVMFDADVIGRVLAQEKGWKELSVAEMREVAAALKNIRAAARAKTTALIDGKREDREQVIDALVADAQRNLPSKGPISSSRSAESTAKRLSAAIASGDASLLKPETMAVWLAGGDLSSMWHRAIIQPLQDAKAKEVDILQRVVRPIITAFERMPKETRARFFEKVDGRTLFPTHRTDVEAPTRRFELLMMALNAGNASNLERLLDGRGITPAHLAGAIDTLTKEELDWVQSIWDAADDIWPEVRALEERDSGLAPARIPAVPLVTRHGTYRGGYFPAIYDRRGDATGERQVGQQLASLMDPTFTRPGTPRSHVKKRATRFNGLVSLEPGNILGHFAQVAHDLAFREPLKSVGALVLAPEVQSALKDRLGDERAQTFLRWLKDVGSMRAAEQSQHAKGFMRLLRAVRANTIISILGYSIPTALGDLSNLAAAVPGSDLKAKHFGSALLYSAAHPVDAATLATSKSGEMRTRREQLSRELTKQVRSLTARGPFATGPLAWFKDHAFAFFEWSDILTSTPVWIGSYRQALDEGKNEADAVRFADATIRKLFPSHSAVDTAEVLRDKGFVGSSLMFYGFFNVAFNRYRDIGHQMWKGEGVVSKGRQMGRILAYGMAITALSELLSGRGKEDDEEWWEWFLRKLLVGSASSVPFGGEIAGAAESMVKGKRSNARASPLVETANTIGRAITAISDEDAETEKRVISTLRALGPLAGVPVAQPIRTGNYVLKAVEGEVPVDTPLDIVRGVAYGPPRR